MKLYLIQLCRFIAAVLVMFHHLGIVRSGNIGVYVFFVISGFVIYLKLFSPDQPSPFRFFTNRLTKIFFLYWLALIIMYFVNPFPLNVSAIYTILLIPGHIRYLKVSWTLSYELYFYFLTGIIVYLLPQKYARAFMLLLLAISTITAVFNVFGWIQTRGSFLNFYLGTNTWCFLLGLLSGYLSNTIFNYAKIHIAIPVFILTYISLSAAFVYPADIIFPAFNYGIASMLLICFSTAYEKRKPLPAKTARIFGTLGDASYAIYLFAPIVGTIIPGRDSFEKIIIIILTIVLSILINQTLERKGLDSCRRIILQLKPAVVS